MGRQQCEASVAYVVARNQSRPQAIATAATPPSLSDISSDQKLTRFMLNAAAVCLVATMAIVVFIDWHGV